MENNPLVSVIIPIYNRAFLLADVLKNILNQTYTNIEVIIIDDGSSMPLRITDNHGLNIVLKRLNKNMGPGFARKEGRLLAKGKYIAYLDSDDWWSRDFIEQLVVDLNNNHQVAMVYSKTIVLVNGKEKSRRNEFPASRILPDIMLNKKRPWATSSCLWRADVSLASHWKKLNNFEDYIHDMNVSRHNNIVLYNRQAITYKNQSADNRITRDPIEVRKALKEMVKINKLPAYNGICSFVLFRVYEYNLRILNGKQFFLLPFKEFNINILKYVFYYCLLFFIGILSLKSYRLKRLIRYLR